MLFRSKSGHTARLPDDTNPRRVRLQDEPAYCFEYEVRALVPLDGLEAGCLLHYADRLSGIAAYKGFVELLSGQVIASAAGHIQQHMLSFNQLDLACKILEGHELDDVGAKELYQRLHAALIAVQQETLRVNDDALR